MNYIKSLHIEGFKKFTSLDVEFNEHMNILVGENEAGKSTILDAIKTVLNQQYRNADKSILRDLFNTQKVAAFKAKPSVRTLPRIYIEVELALDPQQKNASYFYGEIYGQRKQQVEKFGIRFECKYDEELGTGMEQSIQEGKIPYEYYTLTWTTFANRPYQMIKRPLNFLAIDTTSSASAPSFNYFNRTLFTSRYDEATKAKAKNEFRDKLIEAFDNLGLPALSENQKFGVDSKKVVLETVLSIYEDSIALENRGSGMESLIKTQIALDRANGLDVILMEEPENHLSFSTLRKMLQQISDQQENSQIIVATHNNMIASRLNLNNVLWTWEACIYKENKDTLDGMIDVQAGAAYKFHDKDYGAVLGSYDDFVASIIKEGFTVDASTLAKSRRCSIDICDYVSQKLGIEIASNGDHSGVVKWIDDDPSSVLDENRIIKLVFREAGKYSFPALNWSYSKGDTVDSACVILTDELDNLDGDKFDPDRIRPSTLNKLYVAMTRSRGDLYLMKASIFKAIRDSYITK